MAKKEYTEDQVQRKKTGRGPRRQPLSAASLKIADIFKDCPSFNGLNGVESLAGTEVDLDPEETCLMTIVNSQLQDLDFLVSATNTASAMEQTVSAPAEQPLPDCSDTATSSGDVPLKCFQSTVSDVTQGNNSATGIYKSKSGTKSKIKAEDVTKMQYEVLIEQKRKLSLQCEYYELMIKKLKSET